MLALLVDLTERIDLLFEQWNYLGPALLLLLCGVGFPLPEEVALIGSGLLLQQGEVEFVPITLICSAAILIGDSIPYWLGRHYGLAALKFRPVRRILHPERFALIERRFQEHGNWVVFTCRFLPGIRIPGYFMAGTFGMRWWRFLALDAAGVLISVPLSIWLGKLFGESIEHLRTRFDQLHLILGFVAVSIILVVFVRARIRRREREVEEVQRERGEGP